MLEVLSKINTAESNIKNERLKIEAKLKDLQLEQELRVSQTKTENEKELKNYQTKLAETKAKQFEENETKEELALHQEKLKMEQQFINRNKAIVADVLREVKKLYGRF